MSNGCGSERPQRLAATLLLAILVGLSACSTSNSSAARSTTTTNEFSPGTSASPEAARQLQTLADSLHAGEGAIFKAVYTATTSNSTQTLTIEQKPPKFLFATKDASAINDPTKSYNCSKSTGRLACLQQLPGINYLDDLVADNTPPLAEATLLDAEKGEASRAAGYKVEKVDFTTRNFAGSSSSCATIAARTQTTTYCVTKGGILAYSGYSDHSLELVSLSTTVSDRDFLPPAGATIITVPGG